MMNKITKKKISKYLIILAIGLFFASPVLAVDLEVQFEDKPLFNNANFLPGENVTRWAKVINNSGKIQRIAVEAINFENSDKLGDALILKITENGNLLYEKDLSRFFNEGEVYLSDLPTGQSTFYDFSISFYPEAGNTFQEKTLFFDILIGFQGTEGGLPPGSGGGGGGGLPRGLTIAEPLKIENLTNTSVVIKWLTNYSSTSSVVYDDDDDQFDLSAGEPKYGYEWIEEGDDTGEPKVVSHAVTLTGLNPVTTYYYRCVSHGSFAVSTEYSFTTLNTGNTGEEENGLDKQEIIWQKEPDQEMPSSNQEERNPFLQSEDSEQEDIHSKQQEQQEQQKYKGETERSEEPSQGILNSLFAAMGNWFENQNLCRLLILLIAILIFIFFWAIKKGKIEKNKLYWFLGLLALALIVLYYLYCPWAKIVVLAIIVISLIIYVSMMLRA